MSANIELLPMPSVLLNWPHPTKHTAIRDYARACIDHAIAAKDAEIEALRDQLAAADYALSEATYALAQQPAAANKALSHADLCRLSRVFNAHNVPGLWQDQRINDWLGERIAAALAAQPGDSDNDL